LLDNDLIRLQIVPELSEPSGGNVGGIPSLNVRRVQTRVELREGQSIALGGVFSRRESSEVTRIPFLGEVPVVGAFLFNTKQATEDENEMLIIVTPELVRPMDADQVPPLPGWYSTHPNDCDLYKYNRIEGNPDLGYYELLPYGNGQGYGQDTGYNLFNPQPTDGGLAPLPTGAAQGPFPNGTYSAPSGLPANAAGGEFQQQGYPQTMPQGSPQPGQPMYGVPSGPTSNQPLYPAPPATNSLQPTPANSAQLRRYPYSSSTGVQQASGSSVSPRRARAIRN
jgi:pilus assembly protein CpaC